MVKDMPSGSDLQSLWNRWKKYTEEDEDEESWWKISTIDAHTEGEPLRIIFGGNNSNGCLPDLAGPHILDRRQQAMQPYIDNRIRKLLMWEPRGHADMYGCWIVPPNDKKNKNCDEDNDNDNEETAHFGVLFLHNEGYSSMCGHGIIAVTKVALEMGLVPINNDTTSQQEVRIDAPAGRIVAYPTIVEKRGRRQVVSKVSFDNVVSFVVALDQSIHVDGIGQVTYDLAFGGAYYAYVSADQAVFAGSGAGDDDDTQSPSPSLDLTTRNATQLIYLGRQIKQAIMKKVKLQHPQHEDLSFLYGTIFVGAAHNKQANNHSRNVCIFADGEVDRSPTGTGVSGRAAIEYQRGNIRSGEVITIESILGTTFSVQVMREEAVEVAAAGGVEDNKKSNTNTPLLGIVPRVTGTAYITGKHEFVLDPEDNLPEGFLVR